MSTQPQNPSSPPSADHSGGGLRGIRMTPELSSETSSPKSSTRVRPSFKLQRDETRAPQNEASFAKTQRSRTEAPRPAKPAHPPRSSSPPRKGGGRGPLLWLLKWTAVLGVWGCIALLLVVAYFAWDLPEADLGAALSRRPSVQILAMDGSPIGAFGDLYGDVIPVTEMPPALPAAVMAVEDRKFYRHFGVDPFGLLRAAVANFRAKRMVQGGSTITQQAAKNIFLSHERTLKRKVQELLLALWLERKFSKDEILTLYLNRVYLGAGVYGVDAAARRYFGVSAREVTPYQAAVLAGLLKAPSKYNPSVNPEAARGRTHVVLNAMIEADVITPEQAQQIETQGIKSLASSARPRPGRAFADWVMETLGDYIGDVDTDIVVKTTLDPRMQRIAEDALSSVLASDGPAKNASQGAVLIMSPDGAVRAMVGGKDYEGSGFNRATQALRQPGSSFKPFVYIAAIESGMTPNSTVDDHPITIKNWSPENFDRKFRGEVTLKEAIARSLNAATVELSENRVGRKLVIQTANKMGLSVPKTAGPAVVLGTEVTSLLTLTSAYAPLANGGESVIAYGLVEVDSRANGQPLYRREGSGLGRVLSEDTVAKMNEMMKGVLEWGTGRSAKLDRPAAGKSGTTQDYRDAWFMGYTADLVAGVWVGNDDNSPMKSVTGGTIPAKIWKQVMMAANKGYPVRDLAGKRDEDAFTRLLNSVLGGGDSSNGGPAPSSDPASEDSGFFPNPATFDSSKEADRISEMTGRR